MVQPDKLLIVVDSTCDHHGFLYLVARAAPIDVRTFSIDVVRLVGALLVWTLRLPCGDA